MAQKNTDISVFGRVDWWKVGIYLVLVIAGALSIYSASYDFDHASIFSFSEFSGKQIRWIGLALCLGLVILLIDSRVFDTYAYPAYIAMLMLLAVTIVIAPDIKGSRSWLVLGPMSLQPAEFAKCTTALALAKLFSSYNFHLNASRNNYFKALAIIFVPIMLILAQKETGSALAYTALFFVLYREGMSGLVLLAALSAVVFFVVAVKFSSALIFGIPSGQAIVFFMIMLIMVLMVGIYCKRSVEARNLLIWFASTSAIQGILAAFGVPVPGYIFFVCVLAVACIYCMIVKFHSAARRMGLVVASVVAAVVFVFCIDFAFNHVLQPHQQMRIKVALGMEDDLRGAGYNVNQSKIAIGSGGMFGKGFLNGTQTKLKYVPEQHTDFIYCTIGEEQGFLGATAVLLIFLALILRIISIAERQQSVFTRVYGYCVASYLIFHLAINIGMVIGLCPVIGIPLPFFSYGGSSLWGFTFLLFILLRLDAARK